MRYDIIEQALLELIKPLLLKEDTKLAELCEQYNAQFDQQFQLPVDFEPGKRYVLIDALGSIGSSLSVSGSSLGIAGDIALYVGSQRSSFLKAKEDTFQMLDLLMKALHNKVLKFEGTAIGTIKWKSDSRFYTGQNHCCNQMNLGFNSKIRIEHV